MRVLMGEADGSKAICSEGCEQLCEECQEELYGPSKLYVGSGEDMPRKFAYAVKTYDDLAVQL